LSGFLVRSSVLLVPALAQEAEGADEGAIVVQGEREIVLDAETDTGSRLGLTVRETPATLDILTQERFLERGLRTSNEALNSAPGVSAIDTGGSPGTVSMRGFGGNSVSHNYDGVHQPSTMTSRNFDSFAFERIEVLKGPASVLYGEGAIGGAINFVPKKPMIGLQEFSGLAQYGSNDTFRVAGDVNLPVNDKIALRALVSYAGSDGYIDRTTSESLSANLGVMLQPTDNLSVFLAAEYFWKDDGPIYWGTPLVSGASAREPSDLISTESGLVLDLALRDTNFQYYDGEVRSDSTWLRSQVIWEIDDVWTLRNDLSYNNGDRLWHDAEGYRFVTASGLVDRRATYIRNPLDFWHERLALSSDGPLFGHRNRFLIGVEHSENDHMSIRRFGPSVAVDPYDFDPGIFPEITPENFPGAGNFTDSGANIKINAVFGENALNVTDDLLVVVGGRYEEMTLRRAIQDYNLDTFTSYGRTYNPFSYRAGVVYDLTEKTQLFAQYTKAAAAVGTLVLLSLGNSEFELTKGESAEAGIKSSFLDDRVSMTLSGYWLRQTDIITRDPSDPNVAIQGGAQSSRGIELALSAAATRQFRIDGNLALVDAQYDELIEAGGADRAGNRPPNVEHMLINLFAVYDLERLPVRLTAGLRHASDTFGDNANTVRANGYTIFDASIGYRFGFGDLTLRVRNLTDETFIERSGSTTVYLGAPRTADLTLRTRL
jgi:iron complex outermembrane receptor protein